jgi:hypothetical protein
MYVHVKLTWIILVVGILATAVCAWKYPQSAVPLTIGIAAAAALSTMLRL